MSGRLLIAGLAWTAAAVTGMVVMRHAGWEQGYAAAQTEAKAAHDTVAAEMRDVGFCRWVALASQEQHCATPATRPAAARDPDHDRRR